MGPSSTFLKFVLNPSPSLVSSLHLRYTKSHIFSWKFKQLDDFKKQTWYNPDRFSDLKLRVRRSTLGSRYWGLRLWRRWSWAASRRTWSPETWERSKPAKQAEREGRNWKQTQNNLFIPKRNNVTTDNIIAWFIGIQCVKSLITLNNELHFE